MRELLKFFGLLLAIAVFTGANAEAGKGRTWIDIDPTASFGSVQVNAPNDDLTGFSVVVYKKSASNYRVQVTKLGHPYRAYAGESCLEISASAGFFSYIRCGYQVQANQVLTINLARVTYHWDASPVKVDLGPRLSGTLYDALGAQTATYSAWALGLDRPDGSGVTHLLPEGDYGVSYDGVPVFAGVRKSFHLGALAVSSFDATPDDRRATIRVHVPHLKYPVPTVQDTQIISDYIRLVLRKMPLTGLAKAYPSYSIGQSLCSYLGVAAGNAIDIKTNLGQDQDYSYRVFPFPQGGTDHSEYELIVNEVAQALVLSPGQTLTLNTEALNVSALNGSLSGFYRVWAMSPDSDNAQDATPFSWVSTYSSDGYCAARYQDSHPVGTDSNTQRPLTGQLFPTRTSLHLLSGRKYVLKSYAYDELGELREQSQYEVDLTGKH